MSRTDLVQSPLIGEDRDMSVETGAAYSSSCQRRLACTFRVVGVWLPDIFAEGVDHCGRSLEILLEIASKTFKS